MDLPHLWHAQPTRLLSYFCLTDVVKYLLGILCRKYKYSKRVIYLETGKAQSSEKTIWHMNPELNNILSKHDWWIETHWAIILLDVVFILLLWCVKHVNQPFQKVLYGGGKNPWICSSSPQAHYWVLLELEIDCYYGMLGNCQPHIIIFFFRIS